MEDINMGWGEAGVGILITSESILEMFCRKNLQSLDLA